MKVQWQVTAMSAPNSATRPSLWVTSGSAAALAVDAHDVEGELAERM
jgi:hypothetical protein